MVLRFWFRKDWGSTNWKRRRKKDPPIRRTLLYHPVHCLLVYYNTYRTSCTDDLSCKRLMRRVQKHHVVQQKYPDIAYNFMIGGEGTVFEGRGWAYEPEVITEDYQEYQGDSIDIGYMGPWADGPMLMTEGAPDVMNQALHELILLGIEYNYIHSSPEIVEVMDELIEIPEVSGGQKKDGRPSLGDTRPLIFVET